MRQAMIFGLLAASFVLVGYTIGVNTGRQQRVDMVLNTSKVSEELEMACLSLWVGEQNRKYAEKTK